MITINKKGKYILQNYPGIIQLSNITYSVILYSLVVNDRQTPCTYKENS